MADAPALDLVFQQTAHTPALIELVHAALARFDPAAIQEDEERRRWRVFFNSGELRDAALHDLPRALAGQVASVSSIDVPDEGWAARSQAHLTPVHVGQIVIAPPWCVAGLLPVVSAQQLVIIQPSMGFGTGHHPTTRLCLALLQKQPLEGARVVDVGTGSGVLAVAAWKLGAREVLAIDCDPDALGNARENVELNGASAVILENRDLSDFDARQADVVLANLTASVLQHHAARLFGMVRAGGRLIASGFASADLAAVERALDCPTQEVAGPSAEDDWVAAVFVNRPTRT